MSSSESPSISRSSSSSPTSSNVPSPSLVPENRPSQLQLRPQGIQRSEDSSQNHSETSYAKPRHHEDQYLPEFLRNSTSQSQDGRAEISRQYSTGTDRKRRLTNSTDDDGRRRTTFDGSDGSDLSQPSGSDDRPVSTFPLTARGLEVDQNVPSNVIDLTDIPSPQRRPSMRHQRLNRTSSSNSSRRYVVPPWQPDSEVSECPICHRPFTWLFRRHHCRKCGRVVCNDCSPHRITIPRQFIVNPPGPGLSSSPTRSSHDRQADTIDLTGEDDGDEVDSGPVTSRRNRSSVINMLEGGEKVRLCNPCVPDPQPEPLPNYPLFMDPNESRSTVNAQSVHQGFGAGRSLPIPTEILGQPTDRFLGIFPRPNDPFSGSSRSQAHMPSGFPRHLLVQDRFDPRLRPLPYPDIGGPISTMPRPIMPNPTIQGRNSSDFRSQPYFHGRYHSLGSNTALPPIGNRPRVRSMLEANPRFPGGMRTLQQSQMSSAGSGSGPSRPRLHETDICPVCRRALPPRGENGDETIRENHIMACINARDPATQGPGRHGESAPTVVYMVPFIATEKDCIGEDGNTQECSICMIEYDVGEELARLECLCKFHRECIRQWLARKQECPVHKLSYVGMSS